MSTPSAPSYHSRRVQGAHYKVFYGTEADFRGKRGADLVEFLQHALSDSLPVTGWIRTEAPPAPEVLQRGIPIPIAHAGERWSEAALGRYAKLKGV